MTHPYADLGYAAAFSSLADIFMLPAWNMPLVRRPISGSAMHDASGLYPMAGLGAAVDIAAGLAALRDQGAVSLVLVPDPLTAPPPAVLQAAFTICRAFKTHYVLDRSIPGEHVNKHHRYEIKKSRRFCTVEIVSLKDNIDTWNTIYGELIKKHGITGYSKFSPEYFRALAEMGGLTTLLARVDGQPVAMSLWLQGGGIAYYHLSAATDQGYRTNAMYLLVDAALEHFRAVPLIHFGGAAGFSDSDDSGLARFKRGFANHAVTAHLCGSILDRQAYAALAAAKPPSDFFPAYRA